MCACGSPSGPHGVCGGCEAEVLAELAALDSAVEAFAEAAVEPDDTDLEAIPL